MVKLRLCIGILFVLLSCAPGKAFSSELKVWMRAYIPSSHPNNPGYTRAVPNKNGKWMIPAPSLGPLDMITELVSSVPIDGDTCFGTDNRTSSSEIGASARLTTAFRMKVDGTKSVRPLVGNSIHFAGQSVAYKCSDGSIISEMPGVLKENSVGNPSVAGSQTQIVIQASGGLPFISAAPKIDYSGDFIFDLSEKKLTLRISYGAFPAFEAYAQLDNGDIKTLLSAQPVGTNVWSLIDLGAGVADRTLEKTVQF